MAVVGYNQIVTLGFAALAARYNCLAFHQTAVMENSQRLVHRSEHHDRALSLNAASERNDETISTDHDSSIVPQEWGGELSDVARIAALLVSDAVTLCLEYRNQRQAEVETQQSSKRTLEKTDGTPVTALDFAIQGYIVSSLKKYELETDERTGNNSFTFLGEEDAEDLRDANHNGLASMALDLARLMDPKLTMGDFLDALDNDENGRESKSGHRSWVLDPIDGTKGLLQGKQYCIGLALCIEGKPVVGILGNPSAESTIGKIMVAIQDHGLRYYDRENDEFRDLPRTIPNAWHTQNYDFEMILECTPSNSSEFTTSNRSKQAGIDYPPYVLSMGPKTKTLQSEIVKPPLPFGPMCYPTELCCGSLVKYFAVASGQVSGFIQLSPSGWVNTWDHAPGILCVQESGGGVVLAESTATVEPCKDGVPKSTAPNTRALPLLDRPQFFVHDGIVAFANESSAAIREQLINSVRRKT